MHDNAYDPRGRFGWLGQPMGFTVWQSTSGQDASSVQCRPSFVDAAGGDLHLSWNDTDCAVDHGGVPVAGLTVDVDGEPRITVGLGSGRLDIGADEVGGAIFADGFESRGLNRWSASAGR